MRKCSDAPLPVWYREASLPKTAAGIALFTLLVVYLLISCVQTDQKQPWRFQKTVTLGDAQPIGLVKTNGQFWVSDAGNNRILKLDQNWRVVGERSFQRPMHLAFHDGKLYIPEYLTDTIRVLTGESVSFLPLTGKPDAPAAVDANNRLVAVADFYNHRVILQEAGAEAAVLGKKGHEPGELFYPTDVKLWGGKIYVADAYNHRVQVFDLRKKPPSVERIIGVGDSIDVASGIDVTEDYLVVADQENSRVLVYNHEGALLQILEKGIDYPADVLVLADKLIVVNFGGRTLCVYGRAGDKGR